jgi:hypothetical protein
VSSALSHGFSSGVFLYGRHLLYFLLNINYRSLAREDLFTLRVPCPTTAVLSTVYERTSVDHRDGKKKSWNRVLEKLI